MVKYRFRATLTTFRRMSPDETSTVLYVYILLNMYVCVYGPWSRSNFQTEAPLGDGPSSINKLIIESGPVLQARHTVHWRSQLKCSLDSIVNFAPSPECERIFKRNSKLPFSPRTNGGRGIRGCFSMKSNSNNNKNKRWLWQGKEASLTSLVEEECDLNNLSFV